MIGTILLDAGGVLVRPAMGNWSLPRNFHAVMDRYLAAIPPEEHLRALRAASQERGEGAKMYSEEQECAHLRELYALCYRERLGLPVTDDALTELALAHTYDDGRFVFYDDVADVLARWKGRYRLGMVSDTHPSLRRVLLRGGVLPLLEVTSLSCDNGVLKPAPLLFERALEVLGADAGSVLFVDDLDKNLFGAEAVGMRAVKMRRPVYTDAPISAAGGWEGPVVASLEELDALLPGL